MKRKCRHHGVTEFALENEGTKYSQYRCLKCRTANVTSRRRKVKKILIDEAGGKCVVCGYDRCVGALHFHHTNPATKKFQIAARGHVHSLAKARQEAAKCILVCANCHAEIESGVISPTTCYTVTVNDTSNQKDKQTNRINSASSYPPRGPASLHRVS